MFLWISCFSSEAPSIGPSKHPLGGQERARRRLLLLAIDKVLLWGQAPRPSWPTIQLEHQICPSFLGAPLTIWLPPSSSSLQRKSTSGFHSPILRSLFSSQHTPLCSAALPLVFPLLLFRLLLFAWTPLLSFASRVFLAPFALAAPYLFIVLLFQSCSSFFSSAFLCIDRPHDICTSVRPTHRCAVPHYASRTFFLSVSWGLSIGRQPTTTSYANFVLQLLWLMHCHSYPVRTLSFRHNLWKHGKDRPSFGQRLVAANRSWNVCPAKRNVHPRCKAGRFSRVSPLQLSFSSDYPSYGAKAKRPSGICWGASWYVCLFNGAKSHVF